MEDEKQTWLKSDLFVVWLCCVLAGILCLISGQWVIGSGLAILGGCIASIDRSDAYRTWVHPDVEEDLLEETGINEVSCLNPKNIPSCQDPSDLD